MASRLRVHSLALVLVVLGLGAAWLDAPQATEAAPTRLPAWTGGVNLYRNGTFTTQKSWLWCTAAGVQIVRNIVDRETDHSTAGQRRYFDWMRTRNRYDLPLSAGVDPAGWTAGLRHFVDDRYRLVSSRTFDSALRSALVYAGHQPAVKDELSTEENLSALVALAGESVPREALGRALDSVALARQRNLPARALSQGQRRRIGLARLMLVKRPLWILDEPTTALDAAGTQLLTRLVAEHLESGGIAVTATHAPLNLAAGRTRALALG